MIVDVLRNLLLAPLELIFEVVFTIAFNITHSEGVALIVLSFVVSTLVLPIYMRAEKLEQEQRLKEQKLSPVVEHIKRTFKGDEKHMMLAAYYRQNHYNPLSQLKSSISILLQIPFFMAAYDLLGVRASDRFSGTGGNMFAFDLGAPDGLFTVGNISINALPILMTLINFLSCYIYTKDLPLKKSFQTYLLTLFFLIALYNSPSVLVIYWTLNNVYSLMKTIVLKNIRSKKRVAQKAKHSAVADNKIAIWFNSLFEREPNAYVFVLAMAFMSVLTGLLIPLAYLSASPEEFISISDPQNPLHYLMSSFFVAVGFFIIWPSVFYFLAKPKIRNVFSILAIGMSVASAVNYLFFGTETGTINTALVFDRELSYSVLQKAQNLLVVIFILIAFVVLYKYKKIITITFIAGILTVLTISAVDAWKVQETYTSALEHIQDYKDEDAPRIMLSSTGENVMVIMLDRAVSGYIPYIFNEFPELEEQFDGFIYYPNCTSFGQNTLKTTSALFGGYEYTPERMDARTDETLAEKHDEALKVLPKLFSDQGYGITLMDLPFPGWSWAGDYSSFKEIDNCYSYHATNLLNGDVENRRTHNLFMYSIFRCSPLCLQELIYDSGDYLSFRKDDFNRNDMMEHFKVLENLEEMTQISSEYPGYLFLINNETTHDVMSTVTFNNYDPYDPQDFEEGYWISNGIDRLYLEDGYQVATYESLVIALRELGGYLDYLREIGVYDNTRIIIVSDHGTKLVLFEELFFSQINVEWYNCLLMVKDFDSEGFATDDTFMTNADVPVIATNGIIDAPVNPYTGNPIDSDLKSGDLYISYSMDQDEDTWNPNYNSGNAFAYTADTVWFKLINGNIYEPDNWVLVDGPGQ